MCWVSLKCHVVSVVSIMKKPRHLCVKIQSILGLAGASNMLTESVLVHYLLEMLKISRILLFRLLLGEDT